MAIYGNALAQGKSEDQALEDVKTVLSKAEVQPGSASDALTAFTQGQGDVLLSYENEAIRAQNEGEDDRLRRPRQHDPDRDPDRGHQGRAGGGAGVRRLPVVGRGPEALGRERLPAGQQGSSSTRRSSRPRRACSRSTSSAAGTKVNDEFFDEASGKRRQDRAGAGGLDCRLSPTPRLRDCPGQASACPGRTSLWGWAWSRSTSACWSCFRSPRSSPSRPAAALGTSGTRSPAPGARTALGLTAHLLADRGRDQRRLRHPDRLGAGPRRVPRQGRAQRADRPALRAADDRRRHHAAVALHQPPTARSASTSAFDQDRGRAGAAVRHPALRRAGGAAGAARARPRGRGGRGLARAPAASRSSAASSSPTSFPAFCPASRSPSRGRWASSARWR